MEQKEKQTNEAAEKKPKLHIPYDVIKKARLEGLTGDQIIIYWWVNQMNRYGAKVFGKPSYESYYKLISQELGFKSPIDSIKKLIAKGWLSKARAEAFEVTGKKIPQYGFRCMPFAKQREEAKYEQQELQKADEETETVIESSKPAPEEDNLKKIYRYGGQYWYEENGEKVFIPQSVADDVYRLKIPPHWVYDFEADHWCAPEDVTVRELEF